MRQEVAKEIKRALVDAPERVETDDHFFFRITNPLYLSAMAYHVLLIPIYGVKGRWILGLASILLAGCFALMVYLNREGRHKIPAIFSSIVVPVHAALSALLLGWNSGWSYWMLGGILITMSNPWFSPRVKFQWSAWIGAGFIIVGFLAPLGAPDIPLAWLVRFLNHALFVGLAIYLGVLYFRTSEQEHDRLEQERRTDHLTQTPNRRDLEDQLRREEVRFERNSKPFAFIMADLDDFTAFNVENGRDCGDFILVSVAHAVKGVLRKQDHVGRWVGAIFGFVLPETDMDGAKLAAEKVRKFLQKNEFYYNGVEYSVTMTFGVAVYERPMPLERLIQSAHDALLNGKEVGKNCVMAAEFGLRADY